MALSIVIVRLDGRKAFATRTRAILPSRRGAISNFRHAGRASAICGADVFSRFQGGGGRQATTGHRSPNLFLGLGRTLQPFQKPARGLTDRFHLPSSLRDAPASEMQEITEGVAPCAQKPSIRSVS